MQLSLYVYPRDVVGILITSLDLKAAASSGGAMSTNGVMQSTASMPVPAHEHATCLHDVQLYSDGEMVSLLWAEGEYEAVVRLGTTLE